MKILAVMTGCAIGGACRFLVGVYAAGRWSGFPYATLIVNITGCFLIGAASVILTEYCKNAPVYIGLFLVAGFLGGLTTFSSFANETVLLLREENIFNALLNVCLNTIGGLIAVCLGMLLARYFQQ